MAPTGSSTCLGPPGEGSPFYLALRWREGADRRWPRQDALRNLAGHVPACSLLLPVIWLAARRTATLLVH